MSQIPAWTRSRAAAWIIASPSLRRAALLALGLAGSLLTPAVQAQVAVHPPTVSPAAWERFAIRVVGRRDGAIARVRVEVPEAITVLGIDETPGGWNAHLMDATDTTAQAIEWDGARIAYREFREFAFLGRVMGHSKRERLRFPVHLTMEDGTDITWRGGPGDARPVPSVQIVGAATVSAGGALVAAGVAFATALVALAVASSRKRTT